MTEYAERIEQIASKLKEILEESEELKRIIQERVDAEQDTECKEDAVEEEDTVEEEDVQESDTENEELITRKPWCCLFRRN